MRLVIHRGIQAAIVIFRFDTKGSEVQTMGADVYQINYFAVKSVKVEVG